MERIEFSQALTIADELMQNEADNALELIPGLFSAAVWNLPVEDLQDLQIRVQQGKSVLDFAHEAIINERLSRFRRTV